MSKYGFLQVLDEEMAARFPFDYEISWDKKAHTVALSFLLEVKNTEGIALVDEDEEVFSEDILFEEAILFYNPVKSQFDADQYLTTLAYDAKKGYSREFLAYLVDFLTQTAEQGLDDLMDFLADSEAVDFEIAWNQEGFDEGRSHLKETDFYPYPRY